MTTTRRLRARDQNGLMFDVELRPDCTLAEVNPTGAPAAIYVRAPFLDSERELAWRDVEDKDDVVNTGRDGDGAPCDATEPRQLPPEKCLVCGHYHGGQGSCVTAHAFIAKRDCPTCVRKGGA